MAGASVVGPGCQRIVPIPLLDVEHPDSGAFMLGQLALSPDVVWRGAAISGRWAPGRCGRFGAGQDLARLEALYYGETVPL